MSISLDIALYLRENKIQNLTLSDRAVLFTLAFRIGSNPFTWVCQSELSKELGITKRNVRKHTSKLRDMGLILINNNKESVSNNCYRIGDLFINYHQSGRSKSTALSSTKGGQNRPPKTHKGGQYYPPDYQERGQNRPPVLHKNESQDIEFNIENNNFKTPKVKYKSKAKLKAKQKENLNRKKRDFVDQEKAIIPVWLKEEIWSEFLHHRKSIKSPMSELAQRKAFNILEKFKNEGQDVDQIINNSIVNGWKGLFPIKLTKEISNGKSYGNNRKEEPFDDIGEMLRRLGCESIADLGSLTSIT